MSRSTWLPRSSGSIYGVGLNGLPLNPQSGTIPKKNILRFMLGLDKQMWIRPLNRTSMYVVSMQYFGQWVLDYDDRMKQPLQLYPSQVNFAALKESENTFTFLVDTMYRKGTLNPQFALAYDVRGAPGWHNPRSVTSGSRSGS